MMRKISASGLLITSLLCSSCSTLLGENVSQYSSLVTAAPLKTDFVLNADTKNPTRWNLGTSFSSKDQKVTYVVLVTLDSLSKCKRLLDSTGVTSRSIDTNLDLITTALAALATAFTPISTVHALTAAVSISSGFKGVLDSDIYQKQTAAIIGAQIESTYLSAITGYVNRLGTLASGPGEIYPQIEVLKLTIIHQQCSIDNALAALAEKAKKASPVDAAVTDKVKVNTAADLIVGKPAPAKWGHMSGLWSRRQRRQLRLNAKGSLNQLPSRSRFGWI